MPSGLRRQVTASPAAILAASRLGRSPTLCPAGFAALEACAALRPMVGAGVELVQEGGAVDAVHVLGDGWACQYITTQDGRRQISALLVPGDVCNPGALLAGRSHVGIRMLTAGPLVSLPRKHLLALTDAGGGIARTFARLVTIEAAILSRRTLCLGRLSARERLAHLLCEIAVRLGHDAAAGTAGFDIPLTQEQLADAMGLTPVHINRTVQQLRTERLIDAIRRRFTIHDVARLRHVGEFRPGYLDDCGIADPAEATEARPVGP